LQDDDVSFRNRQPQSTAKSKRISCILVFGLLQLEPKRCVLRPIDFYEKIVKKQTKNKTQKQNKTKK